MRRMRALFAPLCLAVLPLVGTVACGFDPSCLAAGTHVASPCGEVPIESLRVGDVVYSVDLARGTLHRARVVAVRTARRPCLALTAASGVDLVATPEHPIYDIGRRRYVPAGEWETGRQVWTGARGGAMRPAVVVACRALEGTRVVYDITVASPFHNFLANGVVVHNKSPSHTAPDPPAIEDALEIRDVASDTLAVPVPAVWDGDVDPGFAIQLEADPAVVGTGILRVTSDRSFDALRFRPGLEEFRFEGILGLTLPAPVSSVDLQVSLLGGLDQAQIVVSAQVGDLSGLGHGVHFPISP